MSKLALLFAAVLLAGCGSESTSTTPAADDTGVTGDAATDETSAAEGGTEDTGTPEVAVAAPKTPQMVSVVKMAGNLHATWKNNDTGLSKIELFRKKDSGEYAVAYTYTKLATSQHDVGATAPGTFCYKVRTTRGGVQSEFSNEMCGTP